MKLLTDFEVDGKKLMVKVGKKEQDQIEQAMLAKSQVCQFVSPNLSFFFFQYEQIGGLKCLFSQTGALPEFDLEIERLKIKVFS